jgi:hypothetical protein
MRHLRILFMAQGTFKNSSKEERLSYVLNAVNNRILSTFKMNLLNKEDLNQAQTLKKRSSLITISHKEEEKRH